MQTMGPGQAGGGLHLRATLETGSSKYYWLNHVIGASPLPLAASEGKALTWPRVRLAAFGTLQSLPFDDRNLSTKVIHMYNVRDRLFRAPSRRLPARPKG